MSSVVFLHIVDALIWFGCVLTEMVFERVGDGSETIRQFISEAHWRIDLYVEIPAFVVVLFSGGHLAGVLSWTPAVVVMIVAGLIAVGVNVYCVVLVRRRLAAAQANDSSLWFEIDHSQHRWGAVVLVAQLVALAAAATMFGAG